MNEVIVRRATPDDAASLATLIDGFAQGHPAEHYTRSVQAMREAFFGNPPLAHVLLAEKNGEAIGFGAWRKTYDVFWSMFGGEGLGLYVAPGYRGFGTAVRLVAAICAEIRNQGGRFLQSNYDPALARFYERVAIGRSERACHLSALAFETLAASAGSSVRDMIRTLPDKSLNTVPPG